MKNTILVTLITTVIFLTSCSDDDMGEPVFRLTEFNGAYAMRPGTFLSGYLTDLNCCLIEYQNGKVSKAIYKNTIGQPLPVDGFTGNVNLTNEYHEIVYQKNIVKIIKKIDSDDIPYTPQITQLTLDKTKRIIKRTDSISKDTTEYSYSKNGLLNESVTYNGDCCIVTRKFYFDSNNNLTRIYEESNYNNGSKFYAFEYFDGYDNGINGFKNLGIIEGAFTRSFSQNNFNVYSRASYNNENILQDTMRITLNVEYDEDGYPIYGDCTE
ncbi:hypothetical protein D1164_22550 [Mariniphaga sediminis]|uniref:DUF4595 domain-containing protein n=1 Tax=Mariniphaga sediminis TaxID=1628158 RepID=A0A399CRU7_9BACT|nr:hypothetical protein [Mariniphaga sediminis]RIH62864.1 hypothetical protein D1164_22550 [Mariniphaga sediminis]